MAVCMDLFHAGSPFMRNSSLLLLRWEKKRGKIIKKVT